MRHFSVQTDSLPWAIAIGGSVAKSKGFKINIVSERPEIQAVSACVGNEGAIGQEIQLPSTPEEYQWLDAFHVERTMKEMEVLHGLALDQRMQVMSLQYSMLFSNLLISKYNQPATHGMFYPLPSKAQRAPYEQFSVLVEKEEYLDMVPGFCRGLGMTVDSDSILVLDKLSVREQIFALGALNRSAVGVVILSTANDLNHVAKAWYTDIDCLNQRPVILSVLPPNPEDLDRRHVLYWSQQIPVVEGQWEDSTMEARGWAWKVRLECKFDNHEYYRRKARGEYSR